MNEKRYIGLGRGTSQLQPDGKSVGSTQISSATRSLRLECLNAHGGAGDIHSKLRKETGSLILKDADPLILNQLCPPVSVAL
jgi:hypothetical protein